VHVFTDSEKPGLFAHPIQVHRLEELSRFDFAPVPQWQPPIYKQELQQMKGLLKKFIKQLASGPSPTTSIPYHKLLKISETLCNTTRNQNSQNGAAKPDRDLSSLFIKSMFNDGLLENDMIKKQLLRNPNDDLTETIDGIFYVRVSDSLRQIVASVQSKVSEQKQVRQTQVEEEKAVQPRPQSEPDILTAAIESIFCQY
jgi:hypothetical protein